MYMMRYLGVVDGEWAVDYAFELFVISIHWELLDDIESDVIYNCFWHLCYDVPCAIQLKSVFLSLMSYCSTVYAKVQS
jgi:hypothetical protein